jgi:hypothetical protein
MLDIETLGTKPGSVILSIGAVEFYPKYTEFYRRIKVGSSIISGFSIDPVTVKWWQEQNQAAIFSAFYCNGAVRIEEALASFALFLKDMDTRLWAKGPDFDCVLLAAAYEKIGKKVPWSFRNCRDVRTIFALSGVHPTKIGVKHDALDDAKNQAADVIRSSACLGVALQ